jgi:hypothetical protein
MNPVIEQLIVAAAVLGALAYFVVPLFKRNKKAGCVGGCGCSVAKNPLEKVVS